MTGTDIAQRDYPAPTVLTNDQLTYISKTEFVPAGLRGNLPAILACVATGRALGLDDMTALRSIHIIEGKATFSAELMVQLVRRAGHSITGEFSDGAVTAVGTRIDNGDTITVEWTMAMAERAGLVGKGNWKKYPEAMLWARAVSQLCRMLFADCFAGATYTTEELGSEDTDSFGVPYGDEEDRLFPPVAAGATLSESGSDDPREPADANRANAQGRDGGGGDVGRDPDSLSADVDELLALWPEDEQRLVREYVEQKQAEKTPDEFAEWLAAQKTKRLRETEGAAA